MRVPTVEQQSVLPSNPYSNTSPHLMQSGPGLKNEIAKLGQQAGDAAQAVGGAVSREIAQDDALAKAQSKQVIADAEAAQKRARAALQAEALVELQRKADDDTAALFGREGFDAMRESGPTKDKLDKHLTEIGERFVDPQDRLDFENLGNAALLSRRKSIEEYTTKQNLAGTKATLEGMRSEAVRGASSVDLSPEEMKAALGPVDATYDRILPPEAAAAAKTELRADMSEAMIQRRIQSGDIEGATTIMAGDSSILGPRRMASLQLKVDAAKKDLTAKGVAIEVNALADGARDEYGITTGKALRNAMPKLAEDDERREALEVALEKQSTLEDKRLRELLEVARNDADKADLNGTAVPAEAQAILEKYDAKYLRGLRDDRRARAKSARIERDGTARDKAEARRQQAEVDREAEERFARELIRNPNASHKEFIANFAAEKSAEMGEPVAVSPLFKAKLDRDGAEAVKGVDTKEAAAKRAFASKLEAELGPMTKPMRKGAREDQALTQDWVGQGALQYQAALERNGGKPLDAKQEAELKASIIHQARGEKKVIAAPAPKPLGPEFRPEAAAARTLQFGGRPTATGKNGEKYRLSEDGKRWEIQ